jgi:hypothetical protein
MRVFLVRDMTRPGIGTEHQTGHPGTEAEWLTIEFRKCISGSLRQGVLPRFLHRRHNMIEPAAPVVPGDEDRGTAPQSARHDGRDLIRCPLRADGDVLLRMLAQIRLAVPIEPRNTRQFSVRGVLLEGVARAVRRVASQFGNVREGIAAVVPPAQPRLLESPRQGIQLVSLSGTGPVVVGRIVDDGRVAQISIR